MGEEEIVTVRGEGGYVFEVDLAKNPWAAEQLAAKSLTLIAGAKDGESRQPAEPEPEKPKRVRKADEKQDEEV